MVAHKWNASSNHSLAPAPVYCVLSQEVEVEVEEEAGVCHTNDSRGWDLKDTLCKLEENNIQIY